MAQNGPIPKKFGQYLLEFNLSRGHFYKKMKYLKTETTE
jgi:hypothetical protein